MACWMVSLLVLLNLLRVVPVSDRHRTGNITRKQPENGRSGRLRERVPGLFLFEAQGKVGVECNVQVMLVFREYGLVVAP